MASLDATPEPKGFDLKVEVPEGAISTLASTCASNFYNTLQRLATTEPSEPSSDESSDDGVDRWKIEAESIQRSISELDRLAIHIRQSSTSSLDARVKAFGARKPSEVSSYETRATIAVSCLYPRDSDSLRRYLSNSMTQRHTKLLYWQSHDKKLGADRRRDKQRRDDSIQTPREPSPLPTKAPPLPRQSARDEDTAPPIPGERRVSAGSSFLSGTRASELGSQFTIPPAEAKISTRKRAGASTALQTGAKCPSPPKFEDGELQKPCPLC
ncbi:uncharacterized protein FMAN_14290 [Fusarium mangiferae]|uniref:Uncharacterized protein n=1 Tax=Fusarium mangiferae TaxID=192010 RepID=A0A1L7UEE6_FUSMA|nr:uncharacterized protein FMAN_14290 [Fusarium mangiferae]CVL09018.1 uncharacterized protein FMAN_14290 [Fusarium mangiferae]